MYLSKEGQAEILALGDTVNPHDLVAWAAKHKDSALHAAFEWDNDKAGDEYRVLQARAFLRLVVTVPEQSPHVVRAFVSLQGDRGSVGYRSTASVMRSPDLRGQLIDQFLEEMRQREIKYRQFAELARVFEAIDDVRRKRAKVAREKREAAG